MEATVRKRRTTRPISHYWELVKDMEDNQMLELASLLVNYVRMHPAKAKEQEVEDEDYSLKPYTIEEIHAMIDQSECDIAEGRVYDFDEAMDELEKEFAEEDREQEMAEVV